MRTTRPPLTSPTVRHEPGMGTVEVFALPVDEPTLLSVLRDVFEGHRGQIRFFHHG